MRTKLLSAFALVVALLLSACSKEADIMQYASNNDLIVSTFNLETVLENAGCEVTSKGIEPSEAIEKLNNKTGGSLSAFTDIKGVDLSEIVFSMPDASTFIYVARVTDEKALGQYLESEGFDKTEQDGIVTYSTFGTPIFIKDGLAVMASVRNADASLLSLLRDEAKNNGLTDVQRSHLSDGNAANFVFNIKKLYSLLPLDYVSNFISPNYSEEELDGAAAALAISLSGTKLTSTLNFYDKENKKLESKDTFKPVNTSLLSLASSTDLGVVMMAVPGDFDWESSLSKLKRITPYSPGLDSEVLDILTSVLSNLDGTFMLAGGPKTTIGINELSSWSAVAAAEFKEGKAKEYFQQIKENAAQTLSGIATVTPTADNTLAISIPNQGTFYLQQDGNLLMAGLSPVTKDNENIFKASDFKGFNGAMVIDIPKHNVFSSLISFPFGFKVVYTVKGTELNFTMEETEIDGQFLDNIMRFASTF